MKIWILAAGLMFLPFGALADTQPISGLWRHDIRILNHEDCPAAFLQPDQTFEVRMDIPTPFHPTGRGNTDIEWTRLQPDRWKGIKVESQESPDGLMKAETVYLVTVRSPHHIIQETHFTATVPDKIAEEMGMTGNTCTMESTTDQHYLGN